MLNECAFIGNLGKDVNTKAFNDSTVANFSIAVTSGYGDKKKTHWVDVSAWGKTGEACAKFLSKGKRVYVSGELSDREWDDKNGVKHFTWCLKAKNVVFLTPKNEDQSQSYGNDRAAPTGNADDLGDIPF